MTGFRRFAPLGLGLLGAGCSTLAKVDGEHFFSREGWDLPERVIAALGLPVGARVADIGAGQGYFTFRFSEAVGPGGQVTAVEVDPKLVASLEREVSTHAATNVTVVQGTPHQSNLSAQSIDLAFFCGVFHHVDDPVEYFRRLQTALATSGRVAIVEGPPDPIHGLFMPFHFADAESVAATMRAAGYEKRETFDFLPTLNFQIFAPSAPGT